MYLQRRLFSSYVTRHTVHAMEVGTGLGDTVSCCSPLRLAPKSLPRLNVVSSAPAYDLGTPPFRVTIVPRFRLSSETDRVQS